MSATTAGAIKAHLEGWKDGQGKGLGLSFYRDLAPPDARLPFGVIQEGISQTPERDGDTGDQEVDHAWREEAQVSVYQAWRKPDGSPAEDYFLVGRIVGALDGARLRTAPTTVYGTKVTNRFRRPAVDAPGSADAANGANVVQDTLTVTIRRNL